MDNANYGSKLVPHLVERGLLDDAPFSLIDVGCGLGLDPLWRVFGTQLHAHGLDPQVDEVRRLTKAETNANVHYHASFVGLAADHPLVAREAADWTPADDYFQPFGRSSSIAAAEHASAVREPTLEEANAWPQERLTDENVSLSEFVRREGIRDVDFVKTDTDGHDLEVLVSAEEMLRYAGVLGCMIESNFVGSSRETTNSFHNIDRLMRRNGFMLYGLTVNRYSRAVLPAPFVYRSLASTDWGQAMWGDAVYFRDGASPAYEHVWGELLSEAKLLKLACLYELFRLPDCAVELFLAHRPRLERLVDVDHLLDLLTPPLRGRQVSYREYLGEFERDPTSFYPPNPLPVSGEVLEKLRRTRRVVKRIGLRHI
jgi:Methyltransferase FkbM domain